MHIKTPFTQTKETWPPNYTEIFRWRQRQIIRIRGDAKLLEGALEWYAQPEHAVDFVNHWCDTFDPRNALKELPSRLPFNLFLRQAELMEFVLQCLRDEESGLIDKSRDMGVTWICCALSVWLWLFKEGSSVGWGSRKEQLVDKLGDPDSIFEKIRMLIRGLPDFFLPSGFVWDRHCTYMKIINPERESTITGEAGDNIGRGGRKSIYFKDESAHYEHPESIEASLGDNTRCQIDISTTNGIGTVFDRKRDSGQEWVAGAQFAKGVTRVFVADWRDHPEKDELWHQTREVKARSEGLLHVFRQEVDRDPRSALVGIIIPPEYVKAAIDAHIRLNFGDAGLWSAALDVADEGGDLNALTKRKGVVLRYADDWGEGDVGESARRAIQECSGHAPINLQYDCIGVGAGVKSEANRLKQEKLMPNGVQLVPWNAGATVLDPETHIIPGDAKSPMNKDFYGNLKAQGWWALRIRFEKTYKALYEGAKYDPSELISLDSKLPKLRQIERELSQPVKKPDGRLRIHIDKKPEGARSPNIADSIMMNYFPMRGPMIISDETLARAAQRPPPSRW